MFLYFIPHATVIAIGKNSLVSITKADLAKLKLGHLERPQARQVQSGPDGSSGWLVWCQRSSDELPGFDAATQSWQCIAGIWIGYTQLPGPEDLARTERMDGHAVELGDERQWIIPPAREYNEEGYHWCALPKSLGLDASGEWAFTDLVPRFRGIWKLVCEYANAQDAAIAAAKESSETLRFAFPPLNDMCVEALSLNYRVSSVEVSVLGLLTTETRSRIVSALLDVQALQSVLEKKRMSLGTGTLPDGLDASITAAGVPTNPPLQT